MKKTKVYVTRPLPKEAVALLREKCDVEMEESIEPISKKDLINKLKDKDAVLVSRTKIDEEICNAIKGKCKILANYGVGYDNIDVTAATKNNIFVTYNPNAVTSATANLTMGLILASTRRIVESDKSVRNGFKKWGPLNFLGTNLENKYIGIIGGGRVGTAVAKRAISFDMKVLYTSRRRKKDLENLGASYLDKEELLKKSDIVTLHIPLNDTTIHYIGKKEFEIIKTNAIFINASRGKLVDEKELVQALKSKKLSFAGLDVFENEPEIDKELINMKNVVLTPHIGTATIETRVEMGENCAKNIFAVMNGKTPKNCVNPELK